MQNIIDDSYLDKLGVIKNSDYREHIGGQIVELLNMRVANRVAEIMDDSQLREMTSLPDGRKMAWLENNIPDFQNIIKEELDGIITDMNAVMPQ